MKHDNCKFPACGCDVPATCSGAADQVEAQPSKAQLLAAQQAEPVAVPQEWVRSVMEQAQVFASAWAIAGGRFDSGDGMQVAEQEKEALRAMLAAAPTPPAATMPKGWVMPTEAEIDEYIEDYEMRGDGSDYRPTEQERFVIKDAIMGLLAEIFKGQATTPPAATVPVLEPLTDDEIHKWWGSENGIEDCDLCKLNDFRTVVRAVEAAHAAKLAKRGGV